MQTNNRRNGIIMNNENKQKAKMACIHLSRKLLQMIEIDFEYDNHYKESIEDKMYFADLYFSDLKTYTKTLTDYDKK